MVNHVIFNKFFVYIQNIIVLEQL